MNDYIRESTNSSYRVTMFTDIQMSKAEEPYIQRTWQYYPGTKTVILSLPRQLAKKYHIEEHTNLIISDTGSGILVKKLEVPTND